MENETAVSAIEHPFIIVRWLTTFAVRIVVDFLIGLPQGDIASGKTSRPP